MKYKLLEVNKVHISDLVLGKFHTQQFKSKSNKRNLAEKFNQFNFQYIYIYIYMEMS
jgi:hypothetical protein